ncbi:hypothetical protein K8R30_02305 [archaeon]|nr:hypothetical protein [archaeon]
MKTVWKFTNQRELNKNQFIDYVQRKVFRTIRKEQMLPKNKIITLRKSNSLNTLVLKEILETKFEVRYNTKPNLSSDNLSQSAEEIFENIIKGNFNTKPKTNAPLIQLSDKEIELYAKLRNIKGTSRKQNKKIQDLFKKFLIKNQDLELNILKAQTQLNKK